ncbi:threonylcarbamoyl-AMP synthase [Solemya pervernicosa gill symbiont]|uniref:Threonylcarbamoyl-AMP synthase n=2 Tax=Gammaproteobacteria incertae sedis TaxID=118884 RepID=A0A1T2L6D1_9GAMM|nr:L-threonylcarbamoyladenylate synthase [Candidatus Reidiella endopervernicosa]OOZ40600.1 threonylcarbamoyl-AMP synthase [Solemya pervernicosa gill symbiont]QKQ26613.1 threonylcarbamoyl-AMP synthase [Candidatus Reidiella endopervernicosa]
MSQFFAIHADNPQPRLINQAVEIIRGGGLVVYPTDSCYALGCHIGDKRALDRMRALRSVDDKHKFTLVCGDLSEITTYAKVDNIAYRLMKSHTPGPYTFILKATHEVPRRLMHPKRRNIGIRIPDNAIALALIEALGEPLLSTTLLLPGEEFPLTDPYEMRQILEHQVDLVIDGGYCDIEPTTVVHLEEGDVQVTRVGKGDISGMEG